MAQTNPQPAASSNNVVWIYLSYILGWLFGLIGLAVVKDDERVRFHCAQALAFSAALTIAVIVISFIPILNLFLPGLLSLAGFVYAIVLAVQAGGGKDPEVPVLGDFARKNLLKLFL